MYGPSNDDSWGTWNDIPHTGGSPATKEYVCSYRYACDEGYQLGPEPDPEDPNTIGQSGQRCYKYINSPQTWTQARATCQSDARGRGSDLATVTSPAENDFVLGLVQRAPGWSTKRQWHNMIGCNDITTKNTWVWSGENSRALAGGYANWAIGEPDTNSPRPEPEDACLMMANDYHCGDQNKGVSYCAGQWHNNPQSLKRQAFTCSYLHGCGEAALGYQLEPAQQQRCYKVIPARTTWVDAQKTCARDYAAMSSNLATIVSAEESSFVSSLIVHDHVSAYIGCERDDSTTPSTWKWSGEGGRPVSFADWAPSEPNNFHNDKIEGESKCSMYGGNFQPGKWNDVHDDDVAAGGVQAMVCSFRAACKEEGYFLEPIKQERCYKPMSVAVSWNTAQVICRTDNPKLGTDLATITSAQENVFVQSLITSSAWIGCNDIVRSGTWAWSGEDAKSLCTEAVVGTPPCVPATSDTYTNWKPGEPNNANGSEKICQMYFLDGKWNDRAPDQNEQKVAEFVCSYSATQQFWEPTLKPTAAPTTTKQNYCAVSEAPSKCNAGWTQGKNRCYQYFDTHTSAQFMSWESARQQCRNLLPGKHSDLATITTAAENDLVTGLLQADAFIGCNDMKVNNYWVWSGEGHIHFCDQEDAGSCDVNTGVCPGKCNPVGKGYNNFRTNEPNSWKGHEEDVCVIYHAGDGRGQWNDGPTKGASNVKGYVCSYYAGPVPPVPDTYDVTCSFTIDNAVQRVTLSAQNEPPTTLLEGSSVGAESPMTKWEEVKQVTFSVKKGAEYTLSVVGKEEGDPVTHLPCDGCKCSGLLMICAAPPGSTWNGFTSNLNDWKVSISDSDITTTTTGSSQGAPCLSTSSFHMDGSENAQKIWGPKEHPSDPDNKNKYVLFQATVTDYCGPMAQSDGQMCVDSAFHGARQDLSNYPAITNAPGGPKSLSDPNIKDWFQMWGRCVAGPAGTGYKAIPVPLSLCGTHVCGVEGGKGIIRKGTSPTPMPTMSPTSSPSSLPTMSPTSSPSSSALPTRKGKTKAPSPKESAGGSAGTIVAVLFLTILAGGGFFWVYKKKQRGEPITMPAFSMPSWIRGAARRRNDRGRMARAANELERVAAEAAAANEGSGYVPPSATETTPSKGIEDADEEPITNFVQMPDEGNLLGLPGGGAAGAARSDDPLGAPFGDKALANI